MSEQKLRQLVENDLKQNRWKEALVKICRWIEEREEQIRKWKTKEIEENWRLGLVIDWYNFWVQMK